MARRVGGWGYGYGSSHCSRSKSSSEGKLRGVERERESACVYIYTIGRTRAVNLVIKGPFCYRFNRIMLSRTDRKFGGMATHVGHRPPEISRSVRRCRVSSPLLSSRADHPTCAIHHPPPIGRRKPFLRAVTIWRRAKFISASAVYIYIYICVYLEAFEAGATAHTALAHSPD